jgi:hypothetical protein
MRITGKSWIGLIVGAVFTPVALLLALASGGMGHGHYGLAKTLFPLPMLLTFNGPIETFQILLASLQFPLYGFLAGIPMHRRRILAATAVLHLVLIPPTFLLLTNFS